MANKASDANPVPLLDVLVPMTKDVKRSPLGLIPLAYGLVDWDCDSANAATVLDRIAVMEPDVVFLDRTINVITSSDCPIRCKVVQSAELRQRVVSQPLKRVARPRRNPLFLCRPPVVSVVANDTNVFQS